MTEIFKIIGDLGFPVAAALAGGYFVYLTIKLLLQGVLGSIKRFISGGKGKWQIKRLLLCNCAL